MSVENETRYQASYCGVFFELHNGAGAQVIRLAFAGPSEALMGIQSYLSHDARYSGPPPIVSVIGELDKVLAAIPECNVVLAVLPDAALSRCPGTVVARLPWRINQSLVIDKDWPAILRDFSPVERRKQSIYLRNNYSLNVSTEAQDFELFFDRFYAPTMRGRHGETAITMGKEEALTEVFNHGQIFWIACGAELLAGVLCRLDEADKTIHFKLVGTRDGDVQYLKKEALSAAYYFVAQWACANGYLKVDYQLSVPFLKKGIFQFKRKYNATVSIPPQYQGMTLAITARSDSPQMRSFLESNPTISLGPDNDLVATYFSAAGEDPSRLVPFRCPGIAKMSVASPASIFMPLAQQSVKSNILLTV
jgi:hypothetical protein